MSFVKAKIESTSLSYDSHIGMASIYLNISGEGFSAQKFGGMFYDDMGTILSQFLVISRSKSWEEVQGKEIMADIENGKIVNISSLAGGFRFGRIRHIDVVGFEERAADDIEWYDKEGQG